MKAKLWKIDKPEQVGERLTHLARFLLDNPQSWPVGIRVEKYDALRSLDQNAMIYALYGQIASQCDDQSVKDIRRECKLNFGVPILRAQDPDFRAMYDKIQNTLTYEEELRAMDYLPVTRLMKKAQCTEYIEDILREYGNRGFALAPPEAA